MTFHARVFSLAVVAAALLLVGCGSDDSGTTNGSTDSLETGGETTQAQESGAAGGGEGATNQAPVGASTNPCPGNGETVKLMRVTGVGCGQGEALAEEWAGEDACKPSDGDLRGACTVGRFRCFSTVFGKGLAVSCARPEQAVNFVSRPG
jgi:hypothetical protein